MLLYISDVYPSNNQQVETYLLRDPVIKTHPIPCLKRVVSVVLLSYVINDLAFSIG